MPEVLGTGPFLAAIVVTVAGADKTNGVLVIVVAVVKRPFAANNACIDAIFSSLAAISAALRAASKAFSSFNLSISILDADENTVS